jgi:hypothetical protein
LIEYPIKIYPEGVDAGWIFRVTLSTILNFIASFKKNFDGMNVPSGLNSITWLAGVTGYYWPGPPILK